MKKKPPRPAPPCPAEGPPDPSPPTESAESQPTGSLEPAEIAQVLLDAEPPAGSGEAPAVTVAMPVKDLDLAQAEDTAPRLPPGAALETLSLREMPEAAAARTEPGARSSRSRWLVLAACLLAAAGAGATWMLRPGAPQGTVTTAGTDLEGAVPPELRPYLDQALKGDAKAMHMIALMYWNGLNVRQDRAKGLAWYRKAAAAGDKAARQELSIIEAQ